MYSSALTRATLNVLSSEFNRNQKGFAEKKTESLTGAWRDTVIDILESEMSEDQKTNALKTLFRLSVNMKQYQ